MKKSNDLILKCRKCGHLLFIVGGMEKTGLQILNKLFRSNLKNTGCPECGEENDDLWIIFGRGNYEDAYGKK